MLDKKSLFEKYPNLLTVRHQDEDIRGIHISYANRNSRLSASEIEALYNYFPIYALDYTKELREAGIIDLNEIFKSHFPSNNNTKLSIEIGFGQGENILELARRNSDINYFGIDVFLEGFAKVVKEASREGLNNIIFCHYDALDFLRHSIAPNSLDYLYILFPDPWPKKKQKKRRLVNATTAEFFVSLLKNDGTIIFASDIEDYAKGVEEIFNNFSNLSRVNDEKIICSLRPVITHYERKAIKEGRDINNLVYRAFCKT